MSKFGDQEDTNKWEFFGYIIPLYSDEERNDTDLPVTGKTQE
jgi:hypothetical protein